MIGSKATSISRRNCLKAFAGIGTFSVSMVALPLSMNASPTNKIETLVIATQDELSKQFASTLAEGLNAKEHWVSLADTNSLLSLADSPDASAPSIIMGLADTATSLLMERLINDAGGSFIQTGGYRQGADLRLSQLIHSHLEQLKLMQEQKHSLQKDYAGDFISFIAQI